MNEIKGESRLTFFEATSIIVGHGVGSGILAVPYLAAHNSLREILLILPSLPVTNGQSHCVPTV